MTLWLRLSLAKSSMRFRIRNTEERCKKKFGLAPLELVINRCVSLEELERIFPTSLAVIGVHSAKFENEKLDDQIQHAIQRCGK
jgi:hypothetical protein